MAVNGAIAPQAPQVREVARCFIESALLGDFAARLDVLRTLALSLMRPVARGGLDAGVQVRVATWYDASYGYFPDGEPQRWARHREVWIAYELWARAKGVATGVIAG